MDSDCGSVDQSDSVCVGRAAEASATACQPRQGRNGQSRRNKNASSAGAAPTPSVDAGNNSNIGTVSQQDQTHKGRHSPSSGSMVDKVVAALCQGVPADGLALADLKAAHAEAMVADHEEWQPLHQQHRHTTHASRRSSQSECRFTTSMSTACMLTMPSPDSTRSHISATCHACRLLCAEP